MKNQIKKYGFKDEVLESKVQTELEKIEGHAKTDVSINITNAANALKSIIDHVITEIETLKALVAKHFQPEIQRLTSECDEIDLVGLQTASAHQIGKLNNEIRDVNADLKRSPQIDYDWKKRTWVLLAIAALCAIDAMSNYQAFQVLTGSLLAAIILSIATAGALMAGAHVIGQKARAAQTEKAKRIWIFGALIGAWLIFLFLGTLRQTFSDGGLLNSPLIWATFNLLFFGIALLLAALKLPTKKQWLEYKTQTEMMQKLIELQKKKEDLLGQVRASEERVNKCQQDINMIRRYEEETCFELDRNCERIIALCVKDNDLKGGNNTKLLK